MLMFDTICVILAIILAIILRKSTINLITCGHFLIQYIFDIIFIDIGLMYVLPRESFFVIKLYLAFITIGFLYHYYAPKTIIYLLIGLVAYHAGMWFDSMSKELSFFSDYFVLFMSVNMILQLLFLIGVNRGVFRNLIQSARKSTNIFVFSVVSYSRLYLHINPNKDTV